MLFACTATLIQLSPFLFRKIIRDYRMDEWWKKILTQIDNNDHLLENKAILPFEREDELATSVDPCFFFKPELDPLEPVSGLVLDTSPLTEVNSIDYTSLLFHVNQVTGVCRLCIAPKVAKDVIGIAHGQRHPSFAKSYEIVSRSWYIQGLTKLLCSYIYHCPKCLILQTRRHPPYSSFQPIKSPPVPFHTLTVDFILALLVSREGFNEVMSVTCKYLKRVTLVPGKDTWSEKEWACVLLSQLELIDWSLSAGLISDRDSKFLSKL